MLTYFTFELDLLFKVKLSSEDPPDELEIALQNYKRMKEQITGKTNAQVTEAEKGIIEMMLKRTQMFKGMSDLKKARVLKLRKCLFTVRNMLKCAYRSLLQSTVNPALNH